MTTPVGETVADMVNEGRFGPEDAIRCCHDCLSALSGSSSAGIRLSALCNESSLLLYFVLPQMQRA